VTYFSYHRTDKEIEIIHELAVRVLEFEDALIEASDIFGELDRSLDAYGTDMKLANHTHSLLALALGAKHHNLSRPRMTEKNVIQINGGRCVVIKLPLGFASLTILIRHPLQELTVASYVSNSTFIVGGPGTEDEHLLDDDSSIEPYSAKAEGPSMLIITGPNYSGKSVYIKQVELTPRIDMKYMIDKTS
jgi:DNA mismatch repair protein MSH5